MHIAVAAARAKKHPPKIKQLRVVAPNPGHAALKKKHVPMIRSPVTSKKNRAVALAAVTRTARQIWMATTKNLAA
jgi:hypothetical protein